MSKLIAAIITYYPEKTLLQMNINAILPFVDKLILWENTPIEDSYRFRWFRESDKIKYETFGYNVGISSALNAVIDKYSKEYEYILTMDQDSIFENFRLYRDKCKDRLEKGEAIIGPAINIINTLDEFMYIPTYVITSGVFTRISTLQKIGGYFEDFKVDAIDLELCQRAHLNNIPVLRYMGCNLVQQFGNESSVKIFGRKIVTCGYSPFRLEGIFRNHIIAYRMYKSDYIKKMIYIYYRHIIPGIIFVDKQKGSKLWAIIKGTYNGLYKKLRG